MCISYLSRNCDHWEIYGARGKRDYISDLLNNEKGTGMCVQQANDLVNHFTITGNNRRIIFE